MALISARWQLSQNYDLVIPTIPTYSEVQVLAFSVYSPGNTEPSLTLAASGLTAEDTLSFFNSQSNGRTIISSSAVTTAGYYSVANIMPVCYKLDALRSINLAVTRGDGLPLVDPNSIAYVLIQFY